MLPGGGGAAIEVEIEVEEVFGEGGEGEVGSGAGPLVLFGLLDHAGADGVEFDVGEGADEVGFGEGAGVEAVLPEVAGAVAAGIDHLGVAAVGAAEEDGEGVLVFGDGDEVDVIGHEAEGEEADAGVWEVGGEEVEVDAAVGLGEEDVLVVGAALGDVVGAAWEDDASISWHDIEIVGFAEGKSQGKKRDRWLWTEPAGGRRFCCLFRGG